MPGAVYRPVGVVCPAALCRVCPMVSDPLPDKGVRMRFAALCKSFVKLCVGLGVTFGGLGLVLAFGMLAWIGMPVLAVGLGVMSSAIDELATE
jgi:hypothetical protein